MIRPLAVLIWCNNCLQNLGITFFLGFCQIKTVHVQAIVLIAEKKTIKKRASNAAQQILKKISFLIL